MDSCFQNCNNFGQDIFLSRTNLAPESYARMLR
jgi:hypothetical protein